MKGIQIPITIMGGSYGIKEVSKTSATFPSSQVVAGRGLFRFQRYGFYSVKTEGLGFRFWGLGFRVGKKKV